MTFIAPPPPEARPIVQQGTPQRFCTFDIETYINYFLATVRECKTGAILGEFELYNDTLSSPTAREDLHDILSRYTIVGFNSYKYDLLIVTAFILGANNYELKTINDDIIPGGGKRGMMPWDVERKYNFQAPKYDHIDLFELAHGVHSLKIYGARLRAKKLQELPIHFNNFIMPHQTSILRQYCINDNVVTELLLNDCMNAIDLRVDMSKEYGIDIRSKSDAQAAEAIFALEAKRLAGVTMRKPDMRTYPREFKYVLPSFITFETERLQGLARLCARLVYTLLPKHKIAVPKEFGVIHFYSDEAAGYQIEESIARATDDRLALADDIDNHYDGMTAAQKRKDPHPIDANLQTLKAQQDELSIRQYTMQIGGLHSKFDAGSHYATDEYDIFEIDVSSFYPNIIIQAGLFLRSVGKDTFKTIYQGLIDRKNNATAKLRELDDSDDNNAAEIKRLNSVIRAVKIFINGFYGKLSSHYSKLYSPDLTIGTTITGQLALLMILEQLHKESVQVLSANTDGINVRVHKSQRQWVDDMVAWWCETTGFVMDYNHYKSIHYRDVNNYFAHYASGKVKGIGIFADESIRISPEYFIVRDACFAFVKEGTPVEETINECDDIHMFINLRKVTGGAMKDGEFIGAAVRWYHSTMTNTPLLYAKPNAKGTHAQVAGSECGMPIMDYPDDMPVDIDRDWYIRKAYHTLIITGVLTDDMVYFYHAPSDTVFATTGIGGAVTTDVEHYTDNIDTISMETFMESVGVTKQDRKTYNV